MCGIQLNGGYVWKAIKPCEEGRGGAKTTQRRSDHPMTAIDELLRHAMVSRCPGRRLFAFCLCDLL